MCKFIVIKSVQNFSLWNNTGKNWKLSSTLKVKIASELHSLKKLREETASKIGPF